MSVVNSGKQTH